MARARGFLAPIRCWLRGKLSQEAAIREEREVRSMPAPRTRPRLVQRGEAWDVVQDPDGVMATVPHGFPDHKDRGPWDERANVVVPLSHKRGGVPRSIAGTWVEWVDYD